MDSNKQIAAGVTFLVAFGTVLLLLLTKMSWIRTEADIPDPYIELQAAVAEEFIPVTVIPPAQTPGVEASAPAPADELLDNPSKPAPPSGTHTVTQGPEGEPKQTVTTERKSDYQVEKRQQPDKPGASTKNTQEDKPVKSQQSKAVENAFDKSGKNVGKNKDGDEAPSGNTNGIAGSHGNPHSKGKSVGASNAVVGGGWQKPTFPTNVKSNNLGEVKIRFDVTADGSLTNVKVISNSGVAREVENELVQIVKSKKLVPKEGKKAEPTTGTVIFTFQDPK